MKYRTFGPTGHSVSVIGMGTWRMTGDRAQAIAALRTGLDLGVNHIDTAEMYGDAELIVGEAIKGRREDVFLVSKVLPQNASRRGTRTACERSLKRLGTDRLDCYLLHWRGSVPLEQTVGAFVDLQREGKIRSWGVSNFDADDLEEAYGIEAEPGESVACNQVLYHLQERAIEHAVIPSCESHRRRGGGLQPVRQRRLSRPQDKRRAGSGGDRQDPCRDAVSGGARIPDPASIGFRHSQDRQSETRGGERRGLRYRIERGGHRGDRTRLSARDRSRVRCR